MINRIKLDLDRKIAPIDPNIFGGFAEHLGRCIYGGIYEPNSPRSDKDGFRVDVLEALKRLDMPVMRYPGGNFVSGYRWRDGVGPMEDRKARMDLAWHDIEPNTFGTNEFIQFCRRLGTEPYLVVNAGDGSMREARDWLEYCNGTTETSLVKLRRAHGYEEPHRVKYWGIGNEVDGPWQIGYKTAEEYARTYLEYAKVLKWTDPEIRLLASAVCKWENDWVERLQLLMENAAEHIDYLAIHWYVGNTTTRNRGFADDDFASYMAISERIEDHLSGVGGMIRAMESQLKLEKKIAIAVDEWNVWYRVRNEGKLEETYNLEDALVVAMHFNAFIRHAATVKMANVAQIVNVIAPIMAWNDDLLLQTIFFPFEVFRKTCGQTALDPYWEGETFSAAGFTGLRTLDVSATLRDDQVSIYVVNRSLEESEVRVELQSGKFAERGTIYVVNGPDIKSTNTRDAPNRVGVTEDTFTPTGSSFTLTVEPHSFTALVVNVA